MTMNTTPRNTIVLERDTEHKLDGMKSSMMTLVSLIKLLFQTSNQNIHSVISIFDFLINNIFSILLFSKKIFSKVFISK